MKFCIEWSNRELLRPSRRRDMAISLFRHSAFFPAFGAFSRLRRRCTCRWLAASRRALRFFPKHCLQYGVLTLALETQLPNSVSGLRPSLRGPPRTVSHPTLRSPSVPRSYGAYAYAYALCLWLSLRGHNAPRSLGIEVIRHRGH